MGLHNRHLADDNFTGKDLRTQYHKPEPSLSAMIADAIGSFFSNMMSMFRSERR